MRIEQILNRKDRPAVVTVTPGATIRDLLALLAEHNIGACVVSSDGTSVEGIVSERDVVRNWVGDAPSLDDAVQTVMSSDVETCEPDSSVDELMALMTEHRVRHIPVVREGSLIGIVSIGDLVKHRIDELTFERDQLEGYVRQV